MFCKSTKNYLMVLDLFYNEILTPEDIACFDMEVQHELARIRDVWDKNG